MNRLLKAREQCGLSRPELAKLAGTSQPQIWRLEIWPDPRGRKMTKEWADRLAPHVKVSPIYLLYGDSQGTKAKREKFIESTLEAAVDFGFDLTPEKAAALGDAIAKAIEQPQAPLLLGRRRPPSLSAPRIDPKGSKKPSRQK